MPEGDKLQNAAQRITLLAVALALLLVAGAACRRDATAEGFAIYLVAQNVRPHELAKLDLAKLALEEQPFLALADIVTYGQESHELSLTPATTTRVGELQVPVSGVSFVVCVDRQPIYAGAFWVAYSSLSFDGIIIDTLPAKMGHPLRIESGYPGPGFYSGADPRSDQRIMRSLRAAGKLR